MATRTSSDDTTKTERAYAVARELGMTTAELRSMTSDWEHDWKVTSQMQSLSFEQIEQVRKARQPKGRAGARKKTAAAARPAAPKAAPKASVTEEVAPKAAGTRGRKAAAPKAVATEEAAPKAASTRGRKAAAPKAVATEDAAPKAASTRGRKAAAPKAVATEEAAPKAASTRGRKPAAPKAVATEEAAPKAASNRGRKPARAKSTPVEEQAPKSAEAPAKESRAPRKSERPPAPPLPSPAEVLEKGQAFLQGALAEMGLTQVVVQGQHEDRRFTFNLVGKDALSLVGRADSGARTQTLDSLQSLLSQALFAGDRNAGVIILDVDGFRTGRVDALKGAAEALGAFVRRTGKAVRFAGMNAIDRRAIHLNLGKARDLLAESEGFGAARRLKVWLKREPAKAAPSESNDAPTGGDDA